MNQLFTQNKDAIEGISTIIIGIFIPVLVVFIGSRVQQRSKAEELLLSNKREIALDFISSLHLLFSGEKEYDNKMRELRKQLAIIASIETLKAFNNWARAALISQKLNKEMSEEEATEHMDKIIYYLRKDVGIYDKAIYDTYAYKLKVLIESLLNVKIAYKKSYYTRFQLLWVYELNFSKKNSKQIIGTILFLILFPIGLPIYLFLKIINLVFSSIFKVF